MKKLNLKDFKQTRDGRWVNKTTGYFVRKPISTELSDLSKLSKNNRRNNSHRRHHCSKKMVIRKYNVNKDTDYIDIDMGGMSDGDILYIAEMLHHIADQDVVKESRDRPGWLK